MGNRAMSTKHHCDGDVRGNKKVCQYARGGRNNRPYCKTHQFFCGCGNSLPLRKDQNVCPNCNGFDCENTQAAKNVQYEQKYNAEQEKKRKEKEAEYAKDAKDKAEKDAAANREAKGKHKK